MERRRRLVLVSALIVAALIAVAAAHADTQRLHFRFAVNGWSGLSLGSADVDGDGIPDVIVPRTLDAQVISGASGQTLFTLTPPDNDASLVSSSFAVGDLRGDGETEIVVGAPAANCFAGRVYIFSSTTGAFQAALDSPDSHACGVGGQFGYSVALLKSEHGSGSDVVVGAPTASVGGVWAAGRVYVFAGASHAILRTLTAPSPETQSLFGFTVRVATTDRHSPLAIGEVNATVNGVVAAGRVFVFSERATPDFTIDNPLPDAFHNFGAWFDITTDGRGKPILAIGELNELDLSNSQGRVDVFAGDSLLYSLSSPHSSAGNAFGVSVAFARFERGGAADLMVGAPLESVDGNARGGRAYMFNSRGRLIDSFTAPNHEAGTAFGYPILFTRGSCAAVLTIGAPGDGTASKVDVFASAGKHAEQGKCHP